MGWLRTLLWLTPGVALRWLCETGSIFWSSCESRGEGKEGGEYGGNRTGGQLVICFVREKVERNMQWV